MHRPNLRQRGRKAISQDTTVALPHIRKVDSLEPGTRNLRAPTSRPAAPCGGRSMFRVLRLLGLAPLQAPQSARREDEGENPSHAERVKRPDEQEGWAGLGDLAAKNASRSHHVDDGHARRTDC